MKRNFNLTFRNRDGTDIKVSEKEALKPFMLRDAAMNALDGVYEDDRGLSGEEKIRRSNLAQLIYDSSDGIVDVKAEDIVLIKTLINKAYPAPLVYAQAAVMLETDLERGLK